MAQPKTVVEFVSRAVQGIFCAQVEVKMRCAYCDNMMAGRRYPTRDHVVPSSRGGVNSIRNFAIVCQICNQDKDDLLLSEWLEELRRDRDPRAPIVAKFADDFASFGTLLKAVRPPREPVRERATKDARIVPDYLISAYAEKGYVVDENGFAIGGAKLMRLFA